MLNKELLWLMAVQQSLLKLLTLQLTLDVRDIFLDEGTLLQDHIVARVSLSDRCKMAAQINAYLKSTTVHGYSSPHSSGDFMKWPNGAHKKDRLTQMHHQEEIQVTLKHRHWIASPSAEYSHQK